MRLNPDVIANISEIVPTTQNLKAVLKEETDVLGSIIYG